MTSPRVFFYVQHLLGIGHLKRAAAIARALVEAGAEVDFVLGGAPVAGIAPPGARVVQLPPAIASDAQFTNLLDEHGDKVDERWKVKRKQALLDAFEAAKPDIVLLEMYPFGRRQFRFELLPLLDLAAAPFPKPRGRGLGARHPGGQGPHGPRARSGRHRQPACRPRAGAWRSAT